MSDGRWVEGRVRESADGLKRTRRKPYRETWLEKFSEADLAALEKEPPGLQGARPGSRDNPTEVEIEHEEQR